MASLAVAEPGLVLGHATPVARSRSARGWRRFSRNRLAVLGGACLLAICTLVIMAPVLLPYTPDAADLAQALTPPSLAHLLGTDGNGRDVLVRVIYGGRVSLAVGILSVLLSLLLGTLVGALSSFYGGVVDAFLMRVTDAMIALPTFFLVLAILTFLPGAASVPLAIGITSWMSIARIVRGEFLRWKFAEFVEAAQVIGAGYGRIIARHILPQAMPAIVVSATLGVSYAILTEAAISYLGLGVQPPTPTWGNMLFEAQSYGFGHPLLAIFPGLMILVTVICFNAIGDGLRDALDPRMGED